MELFRKYFDPRQLRDFTESDASWGVYVQNAGHNIHQPKAIYPDHEHPDSYYFDWKKGRVLNEFQLVYISNGEGVFEAEGLNETRIHGGTAFLLFPGVWHRYQPSEKTGWEEFWVGFRGPYADYLLKQKCFHPSSPFLHIGFNAELLNVFIQLTEALKHDGAAYYQLSSCLATQLLALVYSSALLKDTHHQSKSNLIHAARFRMHENAKQYLSMEDLARELNVSYPWFRRAFKEIIGMAPGQYHLNIRMERACALLKQTGLTISEVAYELGFESEFYFSRIFKKKVGLSPTQFRNAR